MAKKIEKTAPEEEARQEANQRRLQDLIDRLGREYPEPARQDERRASS
jgi:hypothetical protein